MSTSPTPPASPASPATADGAAAPVLTDREYHALADQVLALIERQADAWLQQGVVDIDPQRTGGLLELVLPDGGKVVVNKQPPLHEIWLAARRGGYHFRWSGRDWRDTRDGEEFFLRLSEALSAQTGRTLAIADAG